MSAQLVGSHNFLAAFVRKITGCVGHIISSPVSAQLAGSHNFLAAFVRKITGCVGHIISSPVSAQLAGSHNFLAVFVLRIIVNNMLDFINKNYISRDNIMNFIVISVIIFDILRTCAPTSALLWWFIKVLALVVQCAAEYRRTHPTRPPPEPDSRGLLDNNISEGVVVSADLGRVVAGTLDTVSEGANTLLYLFDAYKPNVCWLVGIASLTHAIAASWLIGMCSLTPLNFEFLLFYNSRHDKQDLVSFLPPLLAQEGVVRFQKTILLDLPYFGELAIISRDIQPSSRGSVGAARNATPKYLGRSSNLLLCSNIIGFLRLSLIK